MKLNKKYFLGIFTALAIQPIFGVNLANALPCESEIHTGIEDFYVRKIANGSSEPKVDFFGHADIYYVSPINFWQNLKRIIETYKTTEGEMYPDKSMLLQQIAGARANGDALKICYSQALIDSNSDVNTILNGSSSSKNNNKSSNTSSSSSASKQAKSNQQATNSQSNQSNASSSTASSQNQSNPQGSSSNVDSNNGLNMKPEQAAIVNEASQNYASKKSAFEESHKGLKRTHNKGDEASKCLTRDGKKLKNTCNFRVEYIFCAYKPSQKAFDSSFFEMAAAFDCERSKMGMAGIPAKGNGAGSFTAERLYVIGCKDPSVPRGVTYERGRGLSGWCSE